MRRYIRRIWEPLSAAELESNTICELLAKQDIEVEHATQLIEACPATEALGKTLNVDEGTPLLKAKWYTYNTAGKLVEKIVFHYRYDAFAFKVDLNSASITLMWWSEQVKEVDQKATRNMLKQKNLGIFQVLF